MTSNGSFGKVSRNFRNWTTPAMHQENSKKYLKGERNSITADAGDRCPLRLWRVCPSVLKESLASACLYCIDQLRSVIFKAQTKKLKLRDRRSFSYFTAAGTGGQQNAKETFYFEKGSQKLMKVVWLRKSMTCTVYPPSTTTKFFVVYKHIWLLYIASIVFLRYFMDAMDHRRHIVYP